MRLWGDGASDGARYAFAGVFAERAHSLAEFLSGANRPSPSHVLAESFAAAPGASARARKRALDTGSPTPAILAAHAAASPVIRHSHHSAILLVLFPRRKCASVRVPPALAARVAAGQGEQQSEPDDEKSAHKSLHAM
jgi:hypothetical protein